VVCKSTAFAQHFSHASNFFRDSREQHSKVRGTQWEMAGHEACRLVEGRASGLWSAARGAFQ